VVATAISIVIGERDGVLRAVLRRALEDEGFHLTAVAVSVPDLVRQCGQLRPDVALVSAELDSVDALEEAIRDLLSHGTRTVVLGSPSTSEVDSHLLFAGASGLIHFEDEGVHAIGRAVRAVASGTTALHPDVTKAVLQQWRDMRRGLDVATGVSRNPQLTTRERAVLAALAEGLTSRAAATRLGVAEKTIESHKARIYAKLGARNQAHAIAIAASRGLLRDDA